jgi:hypothetical protein
VESLDHRFIAIALWVAKRILGDKNAGMLFFSVRGKKKEREREISLPGGRSGPRHDSSSCAFERRSERDFRREGRERRKRVLRQVPSPPAFFFFFAFSVGHVH